MRRLFAIGVALLAAVPLGASSIDHRLATVKKAYITPVDDLGVDKPISVCLAKHLGDQTSIAIATSKEEADVIFRVSGNIPSATTRYMVGMMGGTPSAHLFLELPDGTKLWDDGAKLRRAIGKNGKLDSSDSDKTVECGLADELLGTLRNAMRKARDGK
jgi:hypothetical protein